MIWKRAMDVLLVLLAAPFLLPIGLATAFMVARRLGRPVLFVQVRSGLRGRSFRILKFRSMTDDRDAEGKLLPDEDRLPPFGRRLRSTSLDELPQLWNVLKGEMSLVGPRPLLPQYNERYSNRQKLRLNMKPGITGLAQVSGRNALTWSERLELDAQYVENWSLMLDIRIILRTIGAILRRSGAEPVDRPVMPEFLGDREEDR